MGLFSNNIQYAGGVICKGGRGGMFAPPVGGLVMIAMLDGTGMNARYFHLYMGE